MPQINRQRPLFLINMEESASFEWNVTLAHFDHDVLFYYTASQ